MKKQLLKVYVFAFLIALAGCAGADETSLPEGTTSAEEHSSVVNFDKTLDSYTPLSDSYNFYFTYKIVHPWWDAVAMGIEDAVAQYEEAGVEITYEYLAPVDVSAEDQVERIESATASGLYDVIGVDVADVDVVSPAINEAIDEGQKVMTFSSSDAPESERIAYVGNTHNYEDGADLAEALCAKLNYSGKVAILIGSEGAPCHEDRAAGARNVIAKYPDMEIVAVEYDHDSIEQAYELTCDFLDDNPDLDGLICCNMSNPVGAARAVIEYGVTDSVVIVGMDHDREALEYLRDGIIYCLGVQDCYSIGFDTIQTAVKIADGCEPGELYQEYTDEITTIIYGEDAEAMLLLLYGEGK